VKVLVDSSVWIEYFRSGKVESLDRLVEEDLVVTNDVILTELIPALSAQNQKVVIESLEHLEQIRVRIDWDLIRKYQTINLKKGVNKIGIPDLIILQQVIENNLTLYTLDKHFKLMKMHFDFNLLN